MQSTMHQSLATLATEYLDKDKVTPAQARAYTELFGEDPTTFAPFQGLPVPALVAIAGGVRLPASASKPLHEACSGLVKSHVWPKAIAATYLVLTQGPKDEIAC